MRDSTKIGLIGCVLLLAVGLGWYSLHPSEVHEWLRSLGREPLAEDEVIVKQRGTASFPSGSGIDQDVKIRVGDIKRGRTADIEIIGPDSNFLAMRGGAQVGDRIAFSYGGVNYEVEVIRYVDEIGPGDSAKFRIITGVNVEVPLPDEPSKWPTIDN